MILPVMNRPLTVPCPGRFKFGCVVELGNPASVDVKLQICIVCFG